jgi:hypothetical protein
MLLLARAVLAAPAPQALQPAAAPNASALISPEVPLPAAGTAPRAGAGPTGGGAAAPAGGGAGGETRVCPKDNKKYTQQQFNTQCASEKWELATPPPKPNVKNTVAYQQGFKEGREEGKEKGEEEGEIKGIKVTQDLFDCCEAAAGKIPGDPQKNIGTCMDDPEFAKKYGCAPKDDDPKTEERLRTAMADEAKTKQGRK